jgi:anti-sigma regulatory factor (Ser/Thr protein kinase)
LQPSCNNQHSQVGVSEEQTMAAQADSLPSASTLTEAGTNMTAASPSGRMADSTLGAQGDGVPGRVAPERILRLPEQRRAAHQGVSLRLPGEPEAARFARVFARGACLRWQFQAVQDSAVLVVSELVTNAVAHTESRDVRLRLELQPDRLLIEVEDTDSRLPAKRDGLQDATSGRGLVLVDALCAQWDSRATSTGKVVLAHLALAEAEPAVGRGVHRDT